MNEPSVRLGHMECYVEGGVAGDSTKEHNITFLYTLGEGACPASFGINVAKLAGLPDEVLSNAKTKSTEFEQQVDSSATDDEETEETTRAILDAVAANDYALDELWQSMQVP